MAEHLNKTAPRSLFWRLWWRAMLVKRPQAALALASLLVAAAITSLLLNLYSDVRRKMAQEFRAYGSNVVLAPAVSRGGLSPNMVRQEPSPVASLSVRRQDNRNGTAKVTGSLIDQSLLQPLETFQQQVPGMIAVPVLYGIVRLKPVDGRFSDPRLPESVNVVAVGTDFANLYGMYPAWRNTGLNGRVKLDPGTCVLGSHLAANLHVKPGDAITLEPLSADAEARRGESLADSTYRVAGVLSTGASQDEQVFVTLEQLQRCLRLEGKLSMVELAIPGDTAQVERHMRELAGLLPEVDVRPVRQIVYSEGKVLDTIRWLLLSLTALILAIIAICVTATMTAIVLERRRDVGMMKALGAGDSLVMRLFLAEGAGLGLVGGLAGYLLGVLLARGLAHRLFGVALNLSWWALPAVCALTMMIAVIATALPVKVVRGIQPSVVLRGE